MARKQALKLLNGRRPEHPPDIYFIRRKPELLDKYLDDEEMQDLVREAPPKFKLNYNLFRLDPEEKQIMRDMQNKKRNFYNPKDPFFKRRVFDKQYNGVYDTEKVLGIISPRHHSAWMTSSREEIMSHSKELMSSYCDKDRTFYGNKRPTEAFSSIQSSPRSQSMGVSKNENDFKALRKHDKVRQQKDELEKITRIERELSNSIELKCVSKV